MKNLELTCAEFDEDYLEIEDNCNTAVSRPQVYMSFNTVSRSGIHSKGGVAVEKYGAKQIIKYLTEFFELEV